MIKACEKIVMCKLGEAVVTLGYKLEADYVIHTVVAQCIDGKHQEYECLSATYLAALNIADIIRCESMAALLLSSGNNDFDLSLVFD